MIYPELKLVSHKLCPFVQRARIVLAEKEIPHKIEFIDLNNKPQWFRAISPLGRVPVLLVDGKPLFESAVIAEYFDEISPRSLHPDDVFERARNRSWIEFASATLQSIAAFRDADESAFGDATDTLRQRFVTLEAQLGDGLYFNGNYFSLVDAAFGPVFRYFDVIHELGAFNFFDGLPRIEKWRHALSRRPSVRTAVVHDYYERLRRFFAAIDSELGRRARSRYEVAANAS